MERSVIELVTREVIPLVRAALTEASELRSAVQLLGERVETLTAELAGGELSELRRLVSRGLRTLESTQIGGRS